MDFDPKHYNKITKLKYHVVAELVPHTGLHTRVTKGCQDMSNASSAYLGIAVGAVIGGVISWWIYYRQKKIAHMQDFILNRIKELDENHDAILEKIAKFDERHETTLNTILELSKKIDSVVEKQERK